MTILTPPWHDNRHHDGGGFRNVWGGTSQASFGKAAGWILSHGFARKGNRPPPVRPVPMEVLAAAPDRLRITWIGHSSLLVQTPAFTLLTDPMFSRRASPVPFMGPARETPPALRPDDLPPIDLVLISHNHYDHLDAASIRALVRRDDPSFLVPLGVAAIVRGWGATRVAEFDWWQYAEHDGWRLHCTPARHFSGRGLADRNATLWCGWYLYTDDLSLYYAGDSAYASHFTAIGERLGPPDVALLPIGAYRPRWLMAPVHVNPEESVQAFLDLGARHFIPIHWGTFDLAEEPLHEPPAELRRLAAEHGLGDRVHLLDVGGIFSDEHLTP